LKDDVITEVHAATRQKPTCVHFIMTL